MYIQLQHTNNVRNIVIPSRGTSLVCGIRLPPIARFTRYNLIW